MAIARDAQKQRLGDIFQEPSPDGSHTMEAGGDGMSFSEIRRKDVVNICDGRKLGRPIDLILNDSACVQALVVPEGSGGLLSFLKQDREGCVIDWSRVRRIGDDVILVELDCRGGHEEQ